MLAARLCMAMALVSALLVSGIGRISQQGQERCTWHNAACILLSRMQRSHERHVLACSGLREDGSD